jgi:Amidohydrolase
MPAAATGDLVRNVATEVVDVDPGIGGRLEVVGEAQRHHHRRKARLHVERMDHRCLLDTPKDELPSARVRRSKVYVDCNSFGPRAIEAAVRLYGADRIVWGTDGTDFGCQWTSPALAEAEIGEEARDKILHRTAAAMLSPLATIAPLERAAA